jgi:transposase-like protein
MAKKNRTYRRYPIGFKQQAVGRMKAGENVSALARELGIDRSLFYIWSRQIEGRPYGSEPCELPDRRDQRIQELEAKIADLEGALGRKGQELDFFDTALRTIAEIRQKRSGSGETASTEKSECAPSRKAN